MTTISMQKRPQIKKNQYLRRLPLLDFTTKLFDNTDLKDVYIICAQHLVSTTYSLFYTFLKLGLKAHNLAAIGKCYSSDPMACRELNKMNIDVCPSSLKFNSHKSFDAQYRENVFQFVKKRIEKIKSSEYKKIIVLDDGGELLESINNYIEESSNIVGIEQTSSGFNKLISQKLKFPIINVARSFAKLNYESPIIARLVIDTLISHIIQLPLQPKKILIIGNGPIGSQIKKSLKTTYHVSIFDELPSKSCIKKNDFEKTLKNFDLIIGCTGKPILYPKHYNMLKKSVILASASSSDREFNAVFLRRKLPLITNCHENIFINDIWLINCGFPINFSSQYGAIDDDALQLTRSLLLAAVLQAKNHYNCSRNGFISLDYEHQMNIVKKHLSFFGKNKISMKKKCIIQQMKY